MQASPSGPKEAAGQTSENFLAPMLGNIWAPKCSDEDYAHLLLREPCAPELPTRADQVSMLQARIASHLSQIESLTRELAALASAGAAQPAPVLTSRAPEIAACESQHQFKELLENVVSVKCSQCGCIVYGNMACRCLECRRVMCKNCSGDAVSFSGAKPHAMFA